MFQQWIKNLTQNDSQSEEPDSYWVERLCALLLLEIARSDSSVDEVELASIHSAIQLSSESINASEIKEIINTAKEDVETTVSLYGQVREINSKFSREQKLKLVEQMWQVAFSDGDLDKYEEAMIRKLCGLIHINHQEYIQPKLRVTQS